MTGPARTAAARPRIAGARLRELDALRGIAALLVVCLHVVQLYAGLGGDAARGRWLYDLAQGLDCGRVGVVTFFLISGFVIPFSIRASDDAPLTGFVIRRFFRIFPAYWLSVPLGAWAVYRLSGRPFGTGELLANLLLLQDALGVAPAQGVYWTLSIELVFYALCVALALAGSLRDPVRVGLLAAALLGAHTLAVYAIWLGAPLSQPPVFAALHLSLMLCGTLYRSCLLERAATPPFARRLLVALLLYLLVLFPLAAVWARGAYANYVVADALGVALFVAGTTVARVRTRLTDRLGAISYPVYLFHLVVACALLAWLQRQAPGSAWRTQPLGVYVVAVVLMTVPIAALVHRWIEQPCIAFGRRCAARFASARVPVHGGGAAGAEGRA
ncbi:MAG TPA: acyltransferase [Dokdonella sp.]